MTVMGWLRWDGIERAVRELSPTTILEVGTGQGAVGARLSSDARYTGLEPDGESSRVAASRLGTRGTVHHGSTEALSDGYRADLICSFEVLEHIEHDGDALRDWRRRLTAGGHLLISVPAHPERFGPSDRLVGHHRRYSREQLHATVTEAGFRVERIESYGFGLGHLLERVRNALIVRSGDTAADVGTSGSGRFRQPAGWSGIITWAAALPGRALQRIAGPKAPGVGWVLVARAD